MGVKGLWQLLEPVGRPVTLESLEDKVLSVDASIWLNQAVKGMRDKSGQPLPNAHLVVLFNRLCKLLYYRIKPVFVFDGGVPVLKKRTLAARRERKFKARYGSNRAAEKLVKNYLKKRALASVTGRQSDSTIFKNKLLPNEPDVFELPALSDKHSETTSTLLEGGKEENVNEMSLLEEFYSQHNFENKYQDTSMINVDTEDFRSLPEEIQHELIKDKIEDKKWAQMDALPQNAFNFSEFQLQSVLQRGKLHQRLDELRKTMNSRNTGEIAALSSQDELGGECSVQSRRIVSEDNGHFILVKTKKYDNNDSTEPSRIDDSTDEGFLHDSQPHSQPSKPLSTPSFIDVDLNHTSDSDMNSPLLDVPEVSFPSPWIITQSQKAPGKVEEQRLSEKTDIKEMITGEVGLENELIREKETSYREDNDGTSSDTAEKKMSSSTIGEKGTDSQTTQMIDTQGNIMESQGQEKIGNTEDKLHIYVTDTNSTKNKSQIDELGMETYQRRCITKDSEQDEVMEDSFVSKDSSIDDNDAEIKKRKERIEQILQSRQQKSHDVLPKKKIELMNTQDTSHEAVLQQSEHIPQIATCDDAESSVEVDEKTKLLLDEQDELDSKERIDTHDVEDNQAIPVSQDPSNVLRVEISDNEDDNGNAAVVVVDDDDDDDDDGDDDKIDDKVPVQQQQKEQDLLNEIGMEIDDESENISITQEKDKDELHEENSERTVAGVISEFAGSSKEDLELMQRKLEQEQSCLQHEQARQARAAASVSNEMTTESQELLRLFGIPYLVSPMEAEAQCAFLDITNQTHGTITDDSDVFLFGGQRVYKHLFNQNKHPELYTSDAIRGGFALDRSKLIKLALITGSDYTEGIQGLGAVGAMEVLQEFNHDGFEALLKFKKWHDETKENKKTTQETKVKMKLRTISLPTGFPSREVFDSYINPVIDESRESFEWAKPDLHSLRLFAKEKLGWTVNKTDELLLPVMKQLNKQDTQKRLESFFQIKFQETRKKSSKRVRRVVNRFFNPDPLSDDNSSDSEQETSKKDNKQPIRRRTKGPQKNENNSDGEQSKADSKAGTTGSKGKRKMAVSRRGETTRSRSTRGRGQRKPVSKKEVKSIEEDETFDHELLFDSDGEFERLINDDLFHETSSNLDKSNEAKNVDYELASRDKFNEESKVHDIDCGPTKLKGTELIGRQRKVTSSSKRQKVTEYCEPESITTPAKNHKRIHQNLKNVPVRTNRHQQARSPKEKPQKIENSTAFATQKTSIPKSRNSSDDSSTSDDTDSEEERKFRVSSRNLVSKINISVSGVGKKRPKEKERRGGRGRGKRPKTFLS